MIRFYSRGVAFRASLEGRKVTLAGGLTLAGGQKTARLQLLKLENLLR